MWILIPQEIICNALKTTKQLRLTFLSLNSGNKQKSNIFRGENLKVAFWCKKLSHPFQTLIRRRLPGAAWQIATSLAQPEFVWELGTTALKHFLYVQSEKFQDFVGKKNVSMIHSNCDFPSYSIFIIPYNSNDKNNLTIKYIWIQNN